MFSFISLEEVIFFVAFPMIWPLTPFCPLGHFPPAGTPSQRSTRSSSCSETRWERIYLKMILLENNLGVGCSSWCPQIYLEIFVIIELLYQCFFLISPLTFFNFITVLRCLQRFSSETRISLALKQTGWESSKFQSCIWPQVDLAAGLGRALEFSH